MPIFHEKHSPVDGRGVAAVSMLYDNHTISRAAHSTILGTTFRMDEAEEKWGLNGVRVK